MEKLGNFLNVKCLNKINKNTKEIIVVLLIFSLNLFLVMTKLQPGMLEINPDDGAKYIESGRLLLIWGLRDLAWGPLVAFIYAAIHLFVKSSPNWFMLEAWIGNYVLFGFMWLSFYALSRQLNKFISKYVIIGLLFVTTVFFPILENQSDALFVSLSALALLFLIRFKENKKIQNVWLSSLFVGLGVLSRSETVLLIIPLIIFVLIINQKQHQVHKVLLAGLVPVVSILSLFVVANLINFGDPNLGMSGKSYESFLTNQAFLPGSRNETAYLNGEEIFGTKEENQESIIRAIFHNPLAVGERALANLITVPTLFLNFFGKTQAPILLIFCAWGLYTLIKTKDTTLLFLLLIWPLHAFVSLIFLSRHIVPQTSYIVFIFAAIGITHFLSRKSTVTERICFTIVSLGLLVFSIVQNKSAFLSSAILLSVVALAALLEEVKETKEFRLLPGMVLLIGLLFFGVGFSYPAGTLGQSQDEIAAHQLQQAVPVGANVLAPYQTIAIAAKTNSFLLPSGIDSSDELLEYIEDRNIKAVYLDEYLLYSSDVVVMTINNYPGLFNLYYESENGRIRIFLTQNSID